MKRVAHLALLLSACGAPAAEGAKDPSTAGSGAPSAPKVEQQQLVNNGWLDAAIFALEAPALPPMVNSDVLLGVTLSARPLVLECLVDPKNRGAEKRTHVVIDATLGEAGVSHKVTGQNLPPSGASCIEAALNKWTATIPTLNAKASAGGAVSTHLELDHVAGVQPAVTMGVNEVSDVAGTIRLALPGFPECFAAWKSAPPRVLKGSLSLHKAKPPAAQVSPAALTFEPTGDAGADKVVACLTPKLTALSFKSPAGETLTIPLALRFVHSGAGESLPGAPPDLQFTQLDLARGRRTAEAAIAVGGRNLATASYDDAVKRYKAGAKDVSVKELKDKCAALLVADDRLLDAAKKTLAVEDATHLFAQEQKAKDATWAEVEAISAKKQGEAQKDVESFKAARIADEAACPKSRN